MTFKELLDKYQFEDFMPEMRKVWRHKDISGVKMAFDCLKSMSPAPAEGTIDVIITGSDTDPYIRVMDLSNDYWEKGLSKQIIVEENVVVSEKELLASCLWEITFYGSTPRKTEENMTGLFEGWVERNEYDKMIHEMEVRHYRKKVKPRNRSYSRDGAPRYIVRNRDELRKKHLSLLRTNRRKRKAERRYIDRKAYLVRMSRRTELLKQLTRSDSSFSLNDLEFIMTIKEGRNVSYQSFPTPTYRRVAYLEDLILKYTNLPEWHVEEITDIVIFAESSKDTPISVEEGERLRSLIGVLYPAVRLHYGQATNASAGKEILLSLNFIKR